MSTWHDLAEEQKAVLMSVKDKVCLPIIARLPKTVTPNILTYFRIVMVFGLYFLFFLKIPALTVWLAIGYLLAKFTDMIDGSLARYRGRTSLYGEFLDILADKFFYLIGFFILIQLWPNIIALYFIFIVMAISLLLVLINYFQIKLITSQIKKSLKLFRRVFEGAGFVIAIIMLVCQLLW